MSPSRDTRDLVPCALINVHSPRGSHVELRRAVDVLTHYSCSFPCILGLHSSLSSVLEERLNDAMSDFYSIPGSTSIRAAFCPMDCPHTSSIKRQVARY